jgi:hypothetical protein
MWRVALAVAIVGCGDGLALPDGPGSVDTMRGPVTVRVAGNDGSPVLGVLVYFQEASGLVDATAVTGADGTATAQMRSGGLVTVDDGGRFSTIAGVEIGDVLSVPHNSDPPPTVPVTLVAPTDDRPAQYQGWVQGQPFFVQPSGVAVDLPAAATPVDLIVETFDGTLQQRFVATTTTIAAGDTIVLDGPYQDEAVETIELANVPAQNMTGFRRWLATPRGLASMIGDDFISSGTTSLELPSPVIPDATAIDVISTTTASSVIVSFVAHALEVTSMVDFAAIDIAVADSDFVSTGNEVRWSEAGGSHGDFAAVFAPSWTMIAPIETDGANQIVRVPSVPGLGSPAVNSVTSFRIPGGYAAARQTAFAYVAASNALFLQQPIHAPPSVGSFIAQFVF